MNRKPFTSDRGLSLPAVAVLVAAALAACDPVDDPAVADEEEDLTNVEPREPVREAEAAPAPGEDGEEAAREAAIDPSPEDEMLDMPAPDRFAMARIEPASGSDVSGTLNFRQDAETTHIEGSLQGLDPGRHGLHIHVTGDCSAADAASAGGHFGPDDDPHGSPDEPVDRHHVGDLGNIEAGEDGVATFEKSDREMTLGTGDDSIVGRAVIVHAEADDLASQPSGDAGARVGCGVVEREVEPAY